MARIDEILARKAEIRTLLNTEGAEFDADALEAEIRTLTTEEQEIEARAAQVNAMRLAVGAETRAAIEKKSQPKSVEEIRSSHAYEVAFIKGMCSGDYAEARALLTTNVSGGQVPVPTVLEREIQTAWESHELLQFVGTSFEKGNLRTTFELSATGAVIHTEGSAAPTEETITLGVVEIKNEMLKKWITVSDVAWGENTTVDTATYIYAEIAQRIVELAEATLISKIVASPATATATAPGVPKLAVTALSATSIVEAVALLAGKARDLRLVMNRQTYPALVGIAMAAGYAIDVFDGLRNRIHYTDELKPFTTAEDGDPVIIVGDFRRGARKNMPNGNDVRLIPDEVTLAEKDLVKITGKQLVGIGVVADRHFVVVTKSVPEP